MDMNHRSARLVCIVDGVRDLVCRLWQRLMRFLALNATIAGDTYHNWGKTALSALHELVGIGVSPSSIALTHPVARV